MNTAVITALTDPASIAAAEEAKAKRVITFVNGFTVEDEDDYALAGGELVKLRQKADALESTRKTITVPLNTALNAANALFKSPASLLDQAQSLLKQKMLGFRQKQEAIAAAQRAEAERQAAAERARMAAEAATLREKGLEADAQQLEAVAEVTVANAIVAAKPAAKGTSVATTLEFEVVNKMEFVRWIAEQSSRDAGLMDFITFDTIKLRAAVRAHGKNLNFPGVEVTEKQTMRVRA